jgi:hypothetical protein
VRVLDSFPVPWLDFRTKSKTERKLKMNTGNKARFVDMTPTWESMIGVFVALIESGNAQGRKTAIEELTRMAKIADSIVAQSKTGKDS